MPATLATRRTEETELLVRYNREGDLQAREQLVLRFMPLAGELARRYSYADESIDDLRQVAFLGLLKAIDRYEPGRGSKFVSYAAPTILGELKRHFRDKGWALHVPRDLQQRTLAVSAASESLTKRLGRSPSPREVARELDCEPEDVLEAMEAARAYEASSLDAPVRTEDDALTLLDTVAREDAGLELVEGRDAMAREWTALPELEREVVRLRFTEDLTQREIGERIGRSQMHVSRLLRRALSRLETAAVAA
jgi:RNA polymerase sigma-B factor